MRDLRQAESKPSDLFGRIVFYQIILAFTVNAYVILRSEHLIRVELRAGAYKLQLRAGPA